MLRRSAKFPESQLQSQPPDSICLIINPAAGRGRIRARLPAVQAAFRAHGITNFRYSAAPGDEEKLAREAVAAGVTAIVAVGGDGTCSHIADAIVRANARCSLSVVPCGTGNDFAKTLGLTGRSPEEIAELVIQDKRVRIDVGRADGCHFLNSCGFGFDASVLEASNAVRFLKGDAVYIYSALRQLFGYKGIDVSASEILSAPARMLMVTVSNGRSLGGAFQIAPAASVVDGKLDVCFVSDANVFRRVRLFAAAFRGRHVGMPGVVTTATPLISFSFAAAPTMEIDGELRIAESESVQLRCLPSALSVIAAPGAIS